MILKKYLLLITLFLHFFADGQDKTVTCHIQWQGIVTETFGKNTSMTYLYFDDAQVDPATGLPKYLMTYNLPSGVESYEVKLSGVEYAPCSSAENLFLNSTGYKKDTIEIFKELGYSRKNTIGIISFIPLRYNNTAAGFEKVTAFTLNISYKNKNSQTTGYPKREYAEHSVLSNGEWYKLKISKTGIYKIDWDDFQSSGIDPSSIDLQKIGIFGNGGAMLPEKNSKPRPDDLIENAVYIKGGDDGTFDKDDYILFYGQGPGEWNRTSNFYDFTPNLYSDYSYYYLTLTSGSGKRVDDVLQTTDDPISVISTYDFHLSFEEDKVNLINSGKYWYGDEFGDTLVRVYEFDIPDIDTSKNIIVKTNLANRTFESDSLIITFNGEHQEKVSLTTISLQSMVYARAPKRVFQYSLNTNKLTLKYEYFPSSPFSRMWLDNIRINAWCGLVYRGEQLQFFNSATVVEGNVSVFNVQGAGTESTIWEITDPFNPGKVLFDVSGGAANFRLHTDTLRHFIIFDDNNCYKPDFAGKLENQDLHAVQGVDYVIVTHPDFLRHSHQLATLHNQWDNFNTLVVTTEQIFNEFSSGIPDPSAIRDFMKMLYDKSEGTEPRYLLLFGDGSFDPKDRVPDNTNFVPTFQTKESLNSAVSYVMDDYFGFLDDNEGYDGSGVLDIGIGRIPVADTATATEVLNKIIHYHETTFPPFGNWRNKICIVADDEDNNLHLLQADTLAAGVLASEPVYNIEKIYFDSYFQESTSSGERYPDVSKDFNKAVSSGVLIMNYIGHGGELGLAHEKILTIPDILNWKNFDNLPVFLTATCEFTRFDSPYLVSAGEEVLLNPEGGGVALFTTTRLAYASANFTLNKLFYEYAFTRNEGEFITLGDLIKLSKPPGQATTKNFMLLGDPAMRMAYPENTILTTEINGVPVSSGYIPDTLSAFSKITVKGKVTDHSGQLLNDFNGKIIPTVYDKASAYHTLGNNPTSFPTRYYCQDKIIYKGEATVTNGEFQFTFIVPADISLGMGKGKISYYAYSGSSDANGFFNNIFVGGVNENAEEDNTGPVIKIYMDDYDFVSGDLCGKNPVMIAGLFDEHGINTSINGVGHDIVAYLDGDTGNTIILNDYYHQEPDDYQKGSIIYPFFDLAIGKHTLTLKAWDTYNNPASASIEFVVDTAKQIKLSKVNNYPNPFANHTTFTLSYNKPGEELEITLEIYSLDGRKVLGVSTSLFSTGSTMKFFEWDGTNASGMKLDKGIYFYRVKVVDNDDNILNTVQKLIISE